MHKRTYEYALSLLALAAFGACSDSNAVGGDGGAERDSGGISPATDTGGSNTTRDTGASTPGSDTGGTTPASDTGGTTPGSDTGGTTPVAGPYGNRNGNCAVPAGAGPEDVSNPTTVVGTGTPASCTAERVVAAVAAGGVVTFNCGPDPIVIEVPTLKIFNDGGKSKDGSLTLDGGNKVTLSGGGTHRILYQNTCDQAQHWTTSHCNNQDTPHLVLQNIAFANGKGMAGSDQTPALLGGGALYVLGGTFKAYNIKVSDSVVATNPGVLAQDIAGGALYTFQLSKPATIANSTFENNRGSNGGALGSIFISWTIVNSVFSGNAATGHGMNPARSGTEGGGLGGAIYNDGNDYKLSICGSLFQNNVANELGSGSIFQVVNNLNGDLAIDRSTFTGNSNTGSVQASHPGIYVEARDKRGVAGVSIVNSTFQ